MFFVLRDFSQFGTGNLPKLRPISIRIANDLRPLVFMPFERLHGCLLHSRPALRPVAACAGIRIFIALAPLRSTIVIVGFLPACHKPSPGIVDTGGFYPGSRRTASVRANRPAASSKKFGRPPHLPHHPRIRVPARQSGLRHHKSAMPASLPAHPLHTETPYPSEKSTVGNAAGSANYFDSS